jgi:hypothetical protein
VRPQLDGNGVPREDIGYVARRFTEADEHPVFWERWVWRRRGPIRLRETSPNRTPKEKK